MVSRAFWSAVVACAVLPGTVRAQPDPSEHHHAGPLHFYGFPYGPRVAPPWTYPGLSGGPTVGYTGTPGGATVGILGLFGPSGPALCRPRAPVYEPVPAVVASTRLVRQWQTAPFPALGGYGWHGFYNASPRPHNLNVSAWPAGAPSAGAAGQTGPGGACLVLSVRVPSSAEILVDGKRTTQTGADRTFESPPLEAGQNYRYTLTARWVEDGRTVEVSKTVTGAPGEVVTVDFGAAAVATGK
jgi:uncharacterized protein (TIGR03000 family)